MSTAGCSHRNISFALSVPRAASPPVSPLSRSLLTRRTGGPEIDTTWRLMLAPIGRSLQVPPGRPVWAGHDIIIPTNYAEQSIAENIEVVSLRNFVHLTL